MMNQQDPELRLKVKKTTEKISENMHIVANEPSLAFYRIQEHVRKTLPLIVERRADVIALKEQLQGKCYDLEYNVSAVKSIENSEEPLKNVQELLKNAIFLKQQLKYEESRRSKKDSSNSVYKRLSAHITLDLPDLDISGVVEHFTRTNTTNPTQNPGPSTSTATVATSSSTNTTLTTTSTSSDQLQRAHTTLH